MADNGSRLFVISAPSGAGKTTIVGKLCDLTPLQVSISHTTRPPRANEQHGIQYFFVDRKAFIRMRDEDQFVEWAEVFGHYYGTPKHWVEEQITKGNNVLFEVDIQGASRIKEKLPQTTLIFICPPSLEALKERLIGRGKDAAETIERRLAAAESEIAHANQYNYVIINDNLDNAVAQIYHIIHPNKGNLCPE